MAENNEPATDPEDRLRDTKAAPRKVLGARRSAQPAPDPRPDIQEKLASLADSVKVLQTQVGGGEQVVEPEPKTRRMKRFQRATGEELADPETATSAPVPDAEARGDEAALNKNIAWPRQSQPDEAPAGLGARAMDYARRHPNILFVLAQGVGLGLLVLGYWLGQSGTGDEEDRLAGPDAKAMARPSAGDLLLLRNGVSDRALEAANTALHAEKTGDLKTAHDLWQGVVAARMPLPGAEYRLAILDIQRGDLPAADIHLSNSLSAGEMMASCYFINACFAGKKSNYPEAARQLGNAVRIEPLNAKYLFCWGEALRRAGKSQAGIDTIAKALDRPASPAELALFVFKQRLARAEAGHDAAFDAEVADHLSKGPVEGDWLLLAAAQDLGRAAYPAAADHLKAAARVLPPEAYSLRVHDYLFQGHAGNDLVGPLVKVAPPPASGDPLDPSAWPAGEADPAVWPPYAPVL